MAQLLEDDLTGLWNRAAFERRLREEIARVRRYGRPCSLCLADLNDFAAVNERFGHEAGDDVLRRVATLLDTFRISDAAFRIGGDEFALLLIETDLAGAAAARARLERLIGQADLYAVTMSMGVAEVQPDDQTDVVMARAARALRARKNLSRTRQTA